MTNRVIAAVSRNGIIGINNDLCWRLSDDLRLFKSLTTGRAILMGRKTFASIGCKPLPDRINIVMSRHNIGMSGVNQVSDKAGLLRLLSSGQSVDVIGGGEVYKAALETGLIDECIITHVDVSVGSISDNTITYFPFQSMSGFVPAEVIKKQDKDERNEYPFVTVRYVRG